MSFSLWKKTNPDTQSRNIYRSSFHDKFVLSKNSRKQTWAYILSKKLEGDAPVTEEGAVSLPLVSLW